MLEPKFNTKNVLKIFWTHVNKYRWRALLLLMLIVFANISEVFGPVLYKRFFDLLSGEIDIVNGEISQLLIATLVLIICIHFLSWIGWRCSMLIGNWFQPRVMTDLEQTSLAYLHGHSYRFFSNNFAGSLVRKVGRLSSAFEGMADQIEFNFIPLTVILIGNLAILWSRSSLLAIILLSWVFVFFSIQIIYARWKLRFDFKRAEIDSEATGVLADSITNAITVKLFTGKIWENGLFKEVTERLRRANTFSWNLSELMDATQAGLMILIEFIIMYVAIGLWKKGLLTIGDFALIQGYLLGIFMRIWEFGRAVRKMYISLADADEMVTILNSPHEVMDALRAKPLAYTNGRIEFKSVSFSFNKTRRILNNLDLEIQPGERVALVGPSGAGKSTVTKLLFRLYDVEKGKILIDGQNIAKVTQESLREKIALVPQEPILFHRSIMDNIRYGRRGATDEDVMEAARKARAHDFIEELQEGYNTFVGERGVKLSGGERQRVAIARAILKNAPILVLDEATSSLDSESESLIQDALGELMKDKTTIVIAHRLSTIMKMDRIVVIAKGRVQDAGTHKQLLEKENGIYRKLWEIQAGGFIK